MQSPPHRFGAASAPRPPHPGLSPPCAAGRQPISGPPIPGPPMLSPERPEWSRRLGNLHDFVKAARSSPPRLAPAPPPPPVIPVRVDPRSLLSSGLPQDQAIFPSEASPRVSGYREILRMQNRFAEGMQSPPVPGRDAAVRPAGAVQITLPQEEQTSGAESGGECMSDDQMATPGEATPRMLTSRRSRCVPESASGGQAGTPEELQLDSEGQHSGVCDVQRSLPCDATVPIGPVEPLQWAEEDPLPSPRMKNVRLVVDESHTRSDTIFSSKKTVQTIPMQSSTMSAFMTSSLKTLPVPSSTGGVGPQSTDQSLYRLSTSGTKSDDLRRLPSTGSPLRERELKDSEEEVLEKEEEFDYAGLVCVLASVVAGGEAATRRDGRTSPDASETSQRAWREGGIRTPTPALVPYQNCFELGDAESKSVSSRELDNRQSPGHQALRATQGPPAMLAGETEADGRLSEVLKLLQELSPNEAQADLIARKLGHKISPQEVPATGGRPPSIPKLDRALVSQSDVNSSVFGAFPPMPMITASQSHFVQQPAEQDWLEAVFMVGRCRESEEEDRVSLFLPRQASSSRQRNLNDTGLGIATHSMYLDKHLMPKERRRESLPGSPSVRQTDPQRLKDEYSRFRVNPAEGGAASPTGEASPTEASPTGEASPIGESD
eukprot:Hpha_TRINITY_DN16341_c1_g21::TRINITY_DN16341_c1_g21_i1::g.59807::m.59807